MKNILICDDDQDIINALKIYLENPEYCFFEAHTGYEALDMVREQEIHLILLDIMMPRMDGLRALEQIRAISNVPVILLTARSEDVDIIRGLRQGADDYITKPFNPMEVSARVYSQLRRYTQLGGGSEKTQVLRIGGIELDDRAKEVTVDGKAVSLTPKEYDILHLLMENPGRVYAPQEIYREVWHDIPIGSENTVAVHIRHLREKVEINPAEPRYLKVVFGKGYRMDEPERG